MSKINIDLVHEAEDFVKQLLADKLPESIKFHNIEHAKYVSENAALIGSNCGLNADEINLVRLSAWFHDISYMDNPQNHEEKSAEIAAGFLSSKGVDDKIIDQVKNCILATKIPQQPKDILSKVVCDADMAHLAADDYFERIEKMREEWESTQNRKISKRKFHKRSEKFFQQHEYFTDFAKKEFQTKNQ